MTRVLSLVGSATPTSGGCSPDRFQVEWTRTEIATPSSHITHRLTYHSLILPSNTFVVSILKKHNTPWNAHITIMYVTMCNNFSAP